MMRYNISQLVAGQVSVRLPKEQKISAPNQTADFSFSPRHKQPKHAARPTFHASAPNISSLSFVEKPAKLNEITTSTPKLRSAKPPILMVPQYTELSHTAGHLDADGIRPPDQTEHVELPQAESEASQSQPRKWKGSFWVLMRSSDRHLNSPLTGELGGAQAGFRTLFPARALGKKTRLSASIRASSALKSAGKELGLGVSVQHHAAIPIEIIIERRLSGRANGGDRFAAIVTTGISDRPLIAGFRLETYVQTGIVGFRHPMPFIGGQASVRKIMAEGVRTSLELGPAVWLDSQSSGSRLDVGPDLALRTHAGKMPLRVSAQWRFRIAGHVSPHSGPAIILAGDF